LLLFSDLIVVLQCSFGSAAEVHDFAGFLRDVGRKMMVFISRDLENGYSWGGALKEMRLQYGNVHSFAYPKDVEDCRLSAMVIERAESLRHAVWQQRHLK
jgi:hypothetical protein